MWMKVHVFKRPSTTDYALGIKPFAIWRSGAGWQFLVKLEQAIQPDEAETLVRKLHTALGFDPVVRNPNGILRSPGSINWKDGKDEWRVMRHAPHCACLMR